MTKNEPGKRMSIVIGADHAGFLLKKELSNYLKDLGYEIIDIGTHSTKPVDYPDVAEKLSLVILENRAERGIVLCGSGVGASIAANKLPGIRASNCFDVYSAHQGVEHDDMNILALGARVIGIELAKDLVYTFLNAKFSGEERHRRRLNKIKDLENRYLLEKKTC
jgi:RpiB/LacA/LacB family sugar-phosphate isomerase